MRDLIIDIGANHGEFAYEIASRNPKCQVIAFEPEPHLFKKLKNSQYKNLITYDIAIASQTGTAEFNVSHVGDWGCSSLFDFNHKNIEKDEYWNNRADLRCFDEKIIVKTDTLENILSKHSFDEISFIKIDTQGFDLIALKSAGKYMQKIKAGMLEVVTTLDKSLYQGDECDLYHALNFLHDNHFTVYRIKANDEACNEMNVYFCRNDISFETIEKKYHLKNLHIYDGKNYWFLPSDKPVITLPRNDTTEYDSNKIDNLFNKINAIESYLLELNRHLLSQKRKSKFNVRLRHILSCFIPSKKLRKKVRGKK